VLVEIYVNIALSPTKNRFLGALPVVDHVQTESERHGRWTATVKVERLEITLKLNSGADVEGILAYFSRNNERTGRWLTGPM
jgi:hypothetical protein